MFITFICGDAITDGFNSTVDAAERYSNQLDDRVKAAGLTRNGVVHAGISGNRWINDITGPNGNGRFEWDVLDIPGITHAIILLGAFDVAGQFPILHDVCRNLLYLAKTRSFMLTVLPSLVGKR